MPEPLDITKLSIMELKSMAYDEICKIELAQTNIKLINQELTKRNLPKTEL